LLCQRPSSTFEIFRKFSVVVIRTATPLFQPFLISKGTLIKKTYSTAFQFLILHKGITGYFCCNFISLGFKIQGLPLSLPENRSKMGCKQHLKHIYFFSKIEEFHCSGIGVSCLVRVEECGKTGFRDSAQCTVTSTNTTSGGM